MSPRRRVLSSALIPVLAIFLAFAAPASAQYYDAVRGSLGFTMDGIERSPNLMGMGRLTLVGDDVHSRFTLWDFGANPVGVLDADSSSTAELFPSTASLSGVHDLPQGEIRQDLAGREARLGYEIWRRMAKTAYGVAGNLGYLRTDNPYTESMERRSSLRQPTAMPVIAGHVPYVHSQRWLYSARLFWSGESSVDQYRDVVGTAMGEFIDQDGTQLDPPEFFSSTEVDVRTTGGGFGVGYDRGASLKAAFTMDFIQNMIKGSNPEPRHTGMRDEKRPYRNTQLTMVGRLGRSLQWGVDGRDWRSQSEEHWFFSVSGGVGGDALVGRGKLLERDENGNALRTRLRWTRGPLEVGAGLSTAYRKVTITPPGLGDPTSFNNFRNAISHRTPNVDSLALPDSVIYTRTEDRSWDAAGAVLLRLPRHRGTWGVEFHRLRGLLTQDYSTLATLDGAGKTVYTMADQEGPLRTGWDARTGFETRLTEVLTGRAGYMYRWLDRDDHLEQNEFRAHALTLGFGLRPPGATWTVDAGYAVEWQRADYGSPWSPRACRQQLASMVRWVF